VVQFSGGGEVTPPGVEIGVVEKPVHPLSKSGRVEET